MRILKESGGPSAGLALSALIIALSLGCGGGGEAPPSAAPPAASAPEYAPSAQPSGTLPLVDSRGDTVQAAAGGESAGGSDDLTWTVPAAWVTETPSSGMRRAQYALPAAAGDPEGSECAVFYFGPGQGGDIQSNVNRWASQFSAPGGHPTPELTETVVAGRKVLKVTMEGTYNASTMMGGDAVPKPGSLLLGAIVEGPAGNWFFKCTGPKKTMLAQGKEFESLIQSVRPK